MEFKFHSSLHPSCHHHVTFEKFNLKIHYPPPYGILGPQEDEWTILLDLRGPQIFTYL